MIFVFLQSLARANPGASLVWGLSSDPNIAGYHIYYGTVSHSYSSAVTAGNVASIGIGGLIRGTVYYFAVTSFDSMGDESDFSNEVSYTVPPLAPTTLTSVNLAGGQFGLTVSGVSGIQCVVEASTDLKNWIAVATNTAPFIFADTNTASFGQRFFRVANLSL